MTTGIMRTALLNLVFVGVGGFFGSIGRYLLAGAVYQIFPNLYFPIVIEIVDTDDKVEKFIPLIDEAIKNGLATLEKVRIRLYRSGKSE